MCEFVLDGGRISQSKGSNPEDNNCDIFFCYLGETFSPNSWNSADGGERIFIFGRHSISIKGKKKEKKTTPATSVSCQISVWRWIIQRTGCQWRGIWAKGPSAGCWFWKVLLILSFFIPQNPTLLNSIHPLLPEDKPLSCFNGSTLTAIEKKKFLGLYPVSW